MNEFEACEHCKPMLDAYAIELAKAQEENTLRKELATYHALAIEQLNRQLTSTGPPDG